MWNPFAGAMDRARAHPVQAGMSTLAGMFIPGGNYLANLGFRAYNNHQFNNAAQANTQHMLQQSGRGVNWSTPDFFGQGDFLSTGGAPGGMGGFGSYGGQSALGAGLYNMPQQYSNSQSGTSGLLDFLGGNDYANSGAAGGGLGLGFSGGMGAPGGFNGNALGHSAAGGGFGGGVWNGGGGMHSYQVNSGSLSPSNYGGIGGGGGSGQAAGPYSRPTKKQE